MYASAETGTKASALRSAVRMGLLGMRAARPTTSSVTTTVADPVSTCSLVAFSGYHRMRYATVAIQAVENPGISSVSTHWSARRLRGFDSSHRHRTATYNA